MESPPPTPEAKCPQCKQIFKNYKVMHEHMEAEFIGSQGQHHVHCRICKKPFPSNSGLYAHSRRFHPQDQDLACPSCKKHFVRAADLTRHVELQQCPVLDMKKLEAVREQKLAFAHGLQARHQGDYDEELEAKYMSKNSALRPKAEATVRPYPVQFEVFETEAVDPYVYYQNLVSSGKIAQAVAEKTEAIESAKYKEFLALQKPQLPGCETSKPLDIQQWQQTIPTAAAPPEKGSKPVSDDDLMASLTDYSSCGGSTGPGSIYFNPWEHDDLICMSSKAPSREASPASTRVPAGCTLSIAQSSSAQTITAPARVVVGGNNDKTPTKESSQNVPSRHNHASMPSPTSSSGKRFDPAVIHGYQQYKPRPLRNYDNLVTSTMTPGSATLPTQTLPTQDTPKFPQSLTSQSVTRSKFTGNTIIESPREEALVPANLPATLPPPKSPYAPPPPIYESFVPETANMPQGLTPIKPSRVTAPPDKVPGVVVAVQMPDSEFVADFDEVKKAIATIVARHNPRNADFNINSYYEPLLAKYKCPIPQCYKSFKKPGQLSNHLTEHQKLKKLKYPCPGCKDMFDTVYALVAHTESQSIRCNFRHSKNYGHFMSQAMAGILDVVGEDEEYSTVRFAISKEAKHNFGRPSPVKDQPRLGRSDQFKAATAAIADRAIDEEVEKRRFWEEHEREIEEKKAREREMELAAKSKKEREKKLAEHAQAQERTRQARELDERNTTDATKRQHEEARRRTAKLVQEQQAREKMAREQAAKDLEEAPRHQAKLVQEQAVREQAAREQAAREQAAREQAAREQAARDAGNHRALQEQILPDRNVQMQKGQEAHRERVRWAQMQQQRNEQQQKAHDTDLDPQVALMKAVMAKYGRSAKPSAEQELRNTLPLEKEMQKPHGDEVAKARQEVQVHGLTSVQVKVDKSDTLEQDMNKLDEEEHLLMERIKKIKDDRWKLQQEKEKRVVEAARKEQQARQANGGGRHANDGGWKPQAQQQPQQQYPAQATAFNSDWW